MSHTRRFDHVGITVADLDAVTAFFVGLGLGVETGVRRGRVRPHAAGGRLERLAPTRARPAEACLAVPQASSETGLSDAADIVPLDGESPEPGTRRRHLSVPRAERVQAVRHRTLASRARGRALVRSGVRSSRSPRDSAARASVGRTRERAPCRWVIRSQAEGLRRRRARAPKGSGG